MTTWLDETRFEDPNEKPVILEYDPETWKEIISIKDKAEKTISDKKPDLKDFIEDFS